VSAFLLRGEKKGGHAFALLSAGRLEKKGLLENFFFPEPRKKKRGLISAHPGGEPETGRERGALRPKRRRGKKG